MKHNFYYLTIPITHDSTSRYSPKRNENYVHKNIFIGVFMEGFIHNNLQMEITWVSINRKMNKLTIVYSHDEVILSSDKR